MKILILSFYYPPDLSAGSFRVSALVDALQKLDSSLEIEVITTQPNRYAEYRPNTSKQSFDRVSITRLSVADHTSDILGQSKSFWAYGRQALKAAHGQSYDLIFSTSSRLLTASLGALIARKLNVPLYLDVRDIFVDTLKSLYGQWYFQPVILAASLLERITINSAVKVNLVSEGFSGYFQNRYPTTRFSFISNGVDTEVPWNKRALSVCRSKSTGKADLALRILYAGNVGDGQALHDILPKMAKKLPDCEFIVVGSGGRLSALRDKLSEFSVGNVTLQPPVKRCQLAELYGQADVLFLHLGSQKAFKRVLPSKIFEYAASGKPVLAGVSGYAKKFIESEIDNSVTFSPGDCQSAVLALGGLSTELTDRTAFTEKFCRSLLMLNLAEDIMSFLPVLED